MLANVFGPLPRARARSFAKRCRMRRLHRVESPNTMRTQHTNTQTDATYNHTQPGETQWREGFASLPRRMPNVAIREAYSYYMQVLNKEIARRRSKRTFYGSAACSTHTQTPYQRASEEIYPSCCARASVHTRHLHMSLFKWINIPLHARDNAEKPLSLPLCVLVESACCGLCAVVFLVLGEETAPRTTRTHKPAAGTTKCQPRDVRQPAQCLCVARKCSRLASFGLFACALVRQRTHNAMRQDLVYTTL